MLPLSEDGGNIFPRNLDNPVDLNMNIHGHENLKFIIVWLM
jgi:hypothetical protein